MPLIAIFRGIFLWYNGIHLIFIYCELFMNIFEQPKPLHPLWNGQLPVDPVLILKSMRHLNLSIKVFASSEMQVTGYIERDATGFSVTYNAKELPVRQRYFLAFATGYIEQGFMDTLDKVEFTPADFTLQNMSVANRKSNIYALELLMPQRIVNFCVFKKGMSDIEQLAQTFSVSTSAMHAQLKRCKLVS
jgi:hypothetical protein